MKTKKPIKSTPPRNRGDNLVARCCLCRRLRKIAWILDGYYGSGNRWNGQTCQHCFESVSHDKYGKPKFPKRWLAALKRCGSLAVVIAANSAPANTPHPQTPEERERRIHADSVREELEQQSKIQIVLE